MDDIYNGFDECAGSLVPGVLYPVSLDGGVGEPVFVVACDVCEEYETDEGAAEALVGELGSDYRIESVRGGFAVRDGGGILGAEGALRALESASGGSISESSSSARSSSS